MSEITAARDALLGVQEAYERARAARIAVVRDLAGVEVASGREPALRALVEALLRREAADADEAAHPAERLERVLAEARRARDAREQLRDEPAIQELLAAVDRTWTEALAEAGRHVAALHGQASPRIAEAFDDYLAALGAIHAVAPEYRDEDVLRAQEQIEAAVARLDEALRPVD